MAMNQSLAAAPRTRAYESGTTMALRQLLRHRAAFVGLVSLLVIVGLAIFAPWVIPYDPIAISLSQKLQGPSFAHWLGTDHFGRDLLARMAYGARVSLTVGLSTVLFAAAFGLPIGLLSGFVGGKLDNALMRLMDAFLTFPPLLLGVAIVGLLGADLTTVTLALGIVQIPVLARVVRSSTLAVREETYITATRALGAGAWRLVFQHVLRNILSPLVVQITIVFSAAIVAEASLSFLGLGVQPPTPSWGRDLAEARRYMVDAPWMFMAPTGFIIVSVMAINFMGDGLRDALDPRSWTRKASPAEEKRRAALDR
jgi:peptide/nickel transport system permease protein